MNLPKIRLIVTGILFFGWVGFLAFLAFTKTAPVTLSRSQLVASTHFVLAEVKVDAGTGQPDRHVLVVEDLRPSGPPLSGAMEIANIRDARVSGAADFSSPGKYLLPLTKVADGVYELTHPPRAPGYEPGVRPRPWAYWWNHPEVEQQFNQLVPAKK